MSEKYTCEGMNLREEEIGTQGRNNSLNGILVSCPVRPTSARSPYPMKKGNTMATYQSIVE